MSPACSASGTDTPASDSDGGSGGVAPDAMQDVTTLEDGSIDEDTSTGQDTGVFDEPPDQGTDAPQDGEREASADAHADVEDGAVQSDAGGIDGGGSSDAGPEAIDSICYFGDFDVNEVQEVACRFWPSGERLKPDLGALTGGYQIDSIARDATGKTLAVAGRASATTPARLVTYRLGGLGAATTLASAPSVEATISRPAFSGDGKTVAFLADFDVPGAVCLYVISASGGTPRRLSPLPSSAALDVIDFAWSRGPDSGDWLAYVGDLAQDGVQGLWTMDTSATTPAAVEIMGLGELAPDRDVQSGIQWDWAGRVYYRTNALGGQAWRIHSSDTIASDKQVVTELSSDGGPGSIYAFGLSRGGDRLAFAANGPSASVSQLYVAMTSASSPADPISLATSQPAGVGVVGPALQLPILWSAHDAVVAVVADWPLAAADPGDVFSAWTFSPSEAGVGNRLLGAPQSVDQNVRELAFSRAGSRLVVRGDLATDGAFELFATDDLATPGQEPISRRIEEVPAGGDVLGLESTR